MVKKNLPENSGGKPNESGKRTRLLRLGYRKRRFRGGIGLSPGELVAEERQGASPVKVKLLGYGPDGFTEEECANWGRLDVLRREYPVIWLQVQGAADEGGIRTLCSRMGMHPLAIEDVLNSHARTKVELYENNLLVVTKAVARNSLRETLLVDQVSFFMGEGFLISFQESEESLFEPVANRIRQGTGRIRRKGASYLLFALMDVKVDHLLSILDEVESDIVETEERMLDRGEACTLEEIYQRKRLVLSMLRIVLPTRENANRLEMLDVGIIEEDNRYYFRDLADSARRASERVEHARLILQNMQEFFHLQQEHRTNERMKVLTVFATLFMPLTFLAGIYGMNFSHEAGPWNMPELYWPYGYLTVLMVMAVFFFGMLGWFRYRKWI